MFNKHWIQYHIQCQYVRLLKYKIHSIGYSSVLHSLSLSLPIYIYIKKFEGFRLVFTLVLYKFVYFKRLFDVGCVDVIGSNEFVQ